MVNESDHFSEQEVIAHLIECGIPGPDAHAIVGSPAGPPMVTYGGGFRYTKEDVEAWLVKYNAREETIDPPPPEGGEGEGGGEEGAAKPAPEGDAVVTPAADYVPEEPPAEEAVVEEADDLPEDHPHKRKRRR